ncbi:winged helix-turn-helix domain-containing protein [Streptomyces olivaceoviridis]
MRKLLVRNGWSCQVPARRPIERDDEAVAGWVTPRGVPRVIGDEVYFQAAQMKARRFQESWVPNDRTRTRPPDCRAPRTDWQPLPGQQ